MIVNVIRSQGKAVVHDFQNLAYPAMHILLPCLVVDMEDSHVRELPNYCHFPH